MFMLCYVMHAVLCRVLFLVCMGSLLKPGGIVVRVLAVTTNRGRRVEPFLHSLFLSRNKTPLPPRLASRRNALALLATPPRGHYAESLGC